MTRHERALALKGRAVYFRVDGWTVKAIVTGARAVYGRVDLSVIQYQPDSGGALLEPGPARWIDSARVEHPARWDVEACDRCAALQDVVDATHTSRACDRCDRWIDPLPRSACAPDDPSGAL